MTALVARWQRSGQTVSAFARVHGVTRDQFEYWRRRVGPGRVRLPRREADEVEIGFRPVRLLDAVGVEVVVPSGERVLIREGASTGLVAAVMEALRARC
jgi:transposase-like protein